jgi:NAD(P)-dependent dehydrogenase (short-subunit alcohol dehydrogenase family)
MERARAEHRKPTEKKPKGADDGKKTPIHPPQHQERPGRESELEPRPRFFGSHYRPAGKLEGKVALVTGGDSGIGRSVCVLFAREGADVAFVHLPEEEDDARETEGFIQELGRRAARIPGDVTSPSFCKRAVEEAVRELGRLDILVNNAAFQKHQKQIEDVESEQLEHTFRVNVFGYFEMAKAALAHLPRGGAIINTGSITGLEGSKELLDYSATKGAIHAFTKSLAQSLVPRGIRVNCVAPGPVWTPLNVADRDAKDVSTFGSDTPMGRTAQPEEIAPAYVFFASSGDSSFITGEVLTLLGGDTTAA